MNREDIPGENVRGVDLRDRYTMKRSLASELLYTEGYQSSGGPELARRLFNVIGLSAGMSLLDAGCGTGGSSIIAAREFGASVVAIDASPSNIQICNERANRLGLTGITYQCRDLLEVVPNEKYDRIWCCDVLMYVRDKLRVLSGIRERLAHEGRAVIVDYGSGERTRTPEFLEYGEGAGYDLPTFSQYQVTLSAAGLKCTGAENYTQEFIQMMREESSSFQDAIERGEVDLSQAERQHFIDRWSKKIRFCEEGQLQAFYFIVNGS